MHPVLTDWWERRRGKKHLLRQGPIMVERIVIPQRVADAAVTLADAIGDYQLVAASIRCHLCYAEVQRRALETVQDKPVPDKYPLNAALLVWRRGIDALHAEEVRSWN